MKSCLICKNKLVCNQKDFCSKKCYYRRSILGNTYHRKKWKLNKETKEHQKRERLEYLKTHFVWIKGLTKETDARVQKMGKNVSKSLIGKKRPDMVGEKNIAYRADVKKKKSESMFRYWSDNSEMGLRRKANQLDSVNRGRKVSNTSIEIKVQDFFDKNGIKYQKNISIEIDDGNVGFQKNSIPDQYVEFEGRKICLFEDGLHWHTKTIDDEVKKRLLERGYEVYRFTDEDIHKNWSSVKEKLKTIFHVSLDEDIVRPMQECIEVNRNN